jgi:hypothetical protein
VQEDPAAAADGTTHTAAATSPTTPAILPTRLIMALPPLFQEPSARATGSDHTEPEANLNGARPS